MPTFRKVIDDTAKQTVTDALQGTLSDLQDLAHHTKQAHWAVYGVQFKALHEFTDELTDYYREQADEMGERMLALGVMPQGQIDDIKKNTALQRFPEGFVVGTEVAKLLAERFHTVAVRVRERIAAVGDHDPLTEDMLVALGESLEKHLWMLTVQEG